MAISSNNPRSFYLEGQYQRVCAVCGSAGRFEVHHCLSKQRIKRVSVVAHRSLLLYDRRNALRLCEGCHGRYTNRVMKINTKLLKDQNICFIYEVLGPAGRNLLEREYTGADRRWNQHQEGHCHLCQS